MIATIQDAAKNETQRPSIAHEVSLARIYVLRATYLPLVIPWGYVYRLYVKQLGARWR